MKVAEVTYRRIRNLGNFENAEVTLKAIVEDGDNVKEVLKQLQIEAREFLFPDKTK